MKRSSSITLVILAASSLISGCAEEVREEAQDVYKDRAACIEEWGATAGNGACIQTSKHTWAGPKYVRLVGNAIEFAGNRINRPGVSKSIGYRSISISRGGFGSSAVAHSSSSGG